MLAKKLPGLALGFLLLFLPAALFAQNKIITGKVADSKTAASVAGASVVAKGSNSGTSTNANGEFSLSVPDGVNTITITNVGYAAMDVDITGKTVVTVSLVDAAGDLNEVVVIGYGTARKRDLTGAVASVTAKDFNKGTYTAPDQLIQGKVAGVQVINNSGQPGGGTTVKVRGNSALTGSGQPLYIVDGVPLDGRSSRPGLDAQNLGATPGGNPLNFINPADIASMEILKDASATAIYGSRAAYGVILITTKRSNSGQPKVDFGASAGMSDMMRQIKVLDAQQYAQALTYYGGPASNNKGADVDAMDAITRTGFTQAYNVAVSGGTENARFRFSASALDQEGIVVKSGFKKYTANFSGNFKFLESKKLGIDFSVLPSQYVEDIAPISNNAGSVGSLIGMALQWNPTEALRKSDGSLNIKDGDIVNPLAMSEAYNDRSKVSTILGSVSPYYKFNNWLEYRFLYSINYSTGGRRTSIQQFINLADIKGKGWAAIGSNELVTQQFTNTLNFNKEIASNLNLNAVVGYEYLKYENRGSTVRAYGPDNGGFGNFGLDYTDYIQYSNSAGRTITSFVDPVSELSSYFARAVLNYKDKYLLTGTFRADGSTKFGANNRWGYFPSFAAAWNINKEAFFNVPAISLLKLRASWGKTGNQEFPSGASQGRYTFNNNGQLGQTNNPNPDLKWQSDRQYDLGLDFAVFKGRLSGTVEYFNKATTDLLFPNFPIQPAPPGSVIRWVNLDGTIENKGLEATVNAVIVEKKDFSWSIGVNAAFMKNKVSGLGAPILTGGLHGQGVSGTLVQIIANGLPLNAFWTRQFLGIDPQTGLANYTDENLPFYVGNPNPKVVLGISTSLTYMKFGLSVNMNGAFGQDLYNNTFNNVVNISNITGGRNLAVDLYKEPIKESRFNRVTSSSRFIEKGDYMKLANATLTYGIGNLGKAIKGANVFVTGQNLFVITKFRGFDPEVNTDKSNNGIPSFGIEYTPYPSARTITAGINFSL